MNFNELSTQVNSNLSLLIEASVNIKGKGSVNDLAKSFIDSNDFFSKAASKDPYKKLVFSLIELSFERSLLDSISVSNNIYIHITL
ncbi:hypothetical protein AYI68_g2062 [Smittium mucronatum]|uniref:Uncharacterized protein n=1 Tax=Smittium mucronatum TaxID=133383 RepID=A0A1R0H3S0_9FUNG|nr:hypothetical protein AYI68_g2062 [Smittium mucronatum]